MTEWTYKQLGEYADVQNGYAFKSSDFVNDGVPVIKIKNIVPPYVTNEDVQFVSEDIYNDKLSYALKYNDILISMTGSHVNQMASAVGKIGRIKYDGLSLLNQRVGKLYITNAEKLDYDYLYYFLSQEEIRYNLAASAGGSANQANISPSHIRNIEIPLPPLPTQRRIAAILSSLDDKIENNRKTAEKLEEIAQAIFKRWFVDFEFPNEDGEPYKSSGGEMVYCEELGKDVPKGWEAGTINDCCKKIQNGGTPRRNIEEYWNSNDIFWLTSGEVRENIICKVDNYISKKGFENSSAKLLPKYATVVALYGATAGQVALLAVPTTTNQAISGLVAKKHYTFYNYILLSLSSIELFNKATGSAQQNISKKIVEEFKTTLPNDMLLAKFDDTILQIYDLLISKLNENIILEQSRDTLLPKLMSGEIEV